MSSPDQLRSQIVDAFADHLGLDAIEAEDGSFSFVFSGAGVLNLARLGASGEMAISLSRQMVRHDPTRLTAFLAQAGFDPLLGRLVQTGLTTDDCLVAAVRMDLRALTVPDLVACLERLTAVHDASG